MKKIIILLFVLFFPSFVFAEIEIKRDIIISPSIIDEECKARDMFEYDVKIKNISGGKITLYAVVNDISEEKGIIKYKDPSELPISTSLTRWLEFRRGVIELDVDEERDIPLKINVHEDAPVGVYHARIAVSKGSNRPQATENAYKLNTEELLINIEVKEHVVEKVEIAEFKSKKGIFTEQSIDFSLKIKNIGNKDVTPNGELVVYNSRGKEIVSADFNKEGRVVGSSKMESYPISMNLPASFGKFKAKLRVEYGADRKDLQDVIYFLVMPKFLLIFIVVMVLLLTTFLAFFMSKKKKREIIHRHNTGDFVREPILEEEFLEKKYTVEPENLEVNSVQKKSFQTDLRQVRLEKKENPAIHSTDLRKKEDKMKYNGKRGDKYVINLRSK